MEGRETLMLLGIECGARSHGYAIAAEHLGIPVRLIDCSRSDCIERIRGCDAFIWHFSHQNPREMRTFHAIIIAAMYMGIRVYPDLRTCWMFDDKLSEKYLLEALGEPLVSTHVFFDAEKAKSYFDHCTYPVVHKLAGGAGSTNVHLIRNQKEGYSLTEQTFSGGGYNGIVRCFPKNRQLQKQQKARSSWCRSFCRTMRMTFV